MKTNNSDVTENIKLVEFDIRTICSCHQVIQERCFTSGIEMAANVTHYQVIIVFVSKMLRDRPFSKPCVLFKVMKKHL